MKKIILLFMLLITVASVLGNLDVWLLQDMPYDYNGHNVILVNVNDLGDSCGINIDGTTIWVNLGSQEVINGVPVAVLDAKVVHAKNYDQDTCELSFIEDESSESGGGGGSGGPGVPEFSTFGLIMALSLFGIFIFLNKK
jgi:hypothetical protein